MKRGLKAGQWKTIDTECKKILMRCRDVADTARICRGAALLEKAAELHAGVRQMAGYARRLDELCTTLSKSLGNGDVQ